MAGPPPAAAFDLDANAEPQRAFVRNGFIVSKTFGQSARHS